MFYILTISLIVAFTLVRVYSTGIRSVDLIVTFESWNRFAVCTTVSIFILSVQTVLELISICSNRTVLWLLNSSILERIPNMI